MDSKVEVEGVITEPTIVTCNALTSHCEKGPTQRQGLQHDNVISTGALTSACGKNSTIVTDNALTSQCEKGQTQTCQRQGIKHDNVICTAALTSDREKGKGSQPDDIRRHGIQLDIDNAKISACDVQTSQGNKLDIEPGLGTESGLISASEQGSKVKDLISSFEGQGMTERELSLRRSAASLTRACQKWLLH